MPRLKILAVMVSVHVPSFMETNQQFIAKAAAVLIPVLDCMVIQTFSLVAAIVKALART